MVRVRKKDEMEQDIANKSVKITWFTTIMVLFVIGIIQSIQNNGERNIFIVIATLSVLLNIGLERFYLSRVNEDHSFRKFITIILVIVSVLLLVLIWVTI